MKKSGCYDQEEPKQSKLILSTKWKSFYKQLLNNGLTVLTGPNLNKLNNKPNQPKAKIFNFL